VSDSHPRLIDLILCFQASQKLLLTGTPLQNDVIELMSLLNFLMPKMFNKHHESIKRIFFNRNLSSVSIFLDNPCAIHKILIRYKPFINGR